MSESAKVKKITITEDLITFKIFFNIIKFYSGLKIKQRPLLQNLLPLLVGPSLKTCP